jgi:2-oxoglutarate dehydrogenase E2 component (dihydrolipoamide succinyltransferase)
MNILMPQLGETVAEGTVAAWHKRVGDTVEKNELLLDVETDKAATEVPAPISGVLEKVLVEAGQTVEVGAVLAVISAPGERPEAGSPGFDPGAEHIELTGESDAADEPTLITPINLSSSQDRLRLSPVVRRLIAEHQLDPHTIEGSGRDGRITREDVLAAIEHPSSVAPAEKLADSDGDTVLEPRPPLAPEPSAAFAVRSEQPADRVEPEGGRIAFDRIRRVTAEHMVRSKATSAHVLQAVEVDFAKVEQVRLAARERWRRERGYSLTYLPFIARAACLAIKEFPRINASVDGDGLLVHSGIHLSVAVALDLEGLVAPVIRNADDLTVSGLAQQINELGRRAREGKLAADDLSGGTYTLTNNGSYGTLLTAPIINQPQVAILSVDAIRKQPVVIEGPGGDAIGIRPVGILAQSFDHRAIDGAYSGAFLARVRSLLETKDWAAEL